MLNIDILNSKINRQVRGQEILDLTTSSIDRGYLFNYTRAVLVSEEMVMRPDLLAQMYCGDQNRMGVLLKVNSIGNPFSLDFDEVLFIPDYEAQYSIIKSPAEEGNSDIRKSFRKDLQDRISKISEGRKEYLNAVSISEQAQNQAPTQIPLPPNVTQPGDEEGQFKVENGRLIFGSNVGVCRTNIQQNKSVATIKSRFAQRQIFES
jgi:hypothetical protein